MRIALEPVEYNLERTPVLHPRRPSQHSVEGTIQRPNYGKKTLTLIANGRMWSFTLADDCQLWFQGKKANFRCFHPLDYVRIHYETREGSHVAQAIYLWEFFP